MARRWVQAPEGSHWGEFGPDDQRGRMNLVTPAQVLQGMAEVREGLTFVLSLPLDVPGGRAMNPRRIPPRRYSVIRDGQSAGQQGFCWSYQGEDPDLTDVVNDDVVLLGLQYSTQWDSLAHVGSRFDADGDGVAEAVFYNGFRAGEDIRPGTEDATASARGEPHARYPDPEADAARERSRPSSEINGSPGEFRRLQVNCRLRSRIAPRTAQPAPGSAASCR